MQYILVCWTVWPGMLSAVHNGLFTFMYFLGDFLNCAKYGRLVLTASLVLLQLLLLPCGYLDSTSHTGMPELQCKPVAACIQPKTALLRQVCR